jgi:hypothetical protein
MASGFEVRLLHAGQLTHGASSGSLSASASARAPTEAAAAAAAAGPSPQQWAAPHEWCGRGPTRPDAGPPRAPRLGPGCQWDWAVHRARRWVAAALSVTVTPLCTPTRSPRGRHWHWCAHSGWHWQPASKWPRRRLLGPLNAYRWPLDWRIAGPGRVPHWSAEWA